MLFHVCSSHKDEVHGCKNHALISKRLRYKQVRFNKIKTSSILKFKKFDKVLNFEIIFYE